MTTLRTRAAALLAAVEPMTEGPWPAANARGEPFVWYEMDGQGWTAVGPVHDDEDDNEPNGPAHDKAAADSLGLRALRNDAPDLIRDLLAALDASEAECERLRRVAGEACDAVDRLAADIDLGPGDDGSTAEPFFLLTGNLRAALKEPTR